MKKPLPIVKVVLDSIVGGGQTIGTLDDGRKIFVWGGLPGEEVEVQITKKKSKLAEGYVTNVIKKSKDRIDPVDPISYMSTSPWQIMKFEAEQDAKCALINDAFKLHHTELPNKVEVYSDNRQFGYRNKVEYSWYWNKETEQLDLAFFHRGTHRKLAVDVTSLNISQMDEAAIRIRDLLRTKAVNGYDLKTLLIRCDQSGVVAAQLYVKTPDFIPFTESEIKKLKIQGFELIFSNPKSPASVITEKLQSWGSTKLTDTVMGIDFDYAVEGFFQINLSVYEQALKDMKEWVIADKPLVDLYSGVGTIGLSIGKDDTTLVEINEFAYEEMCQNIVKLKREDTARALLSASEKVLECVQKDSMIILDPPRAGLHDDLVYRLLDTAPERIIYLSCNPVTQARDVQKLCQKYKIKYHRGYNFFPRTPHIEHLVVLELI